MTSNSLPATTGAENSQALSPFARMNQAGAGGGNIGAITIESERAIAEAQGQLILAKRFPRSVTAAITEFLDSCNSWDFADTAFYSVPNRGSGPSIRLAEEAARCYGNFVYGHRELSRSEGKSEIEVFAWDVEKNNRSTRQITVLHIVDTKNGPKKLIDQADIDNRIANVASKQMRGRILALLPKHMIAMGTAAAKRTLAGSGEKPLSERIIAMATAFSKFGVTNAHLQAYLGHPVDHTTIDEFADLTGIFNSLREGTAKASEYFQLQDPAPDTGASIAATAKAAALGKPADTKPGDAPATTPPAAERAPRRTAPAPAPAKDKQAEPAADQAQPKAEAKPKPQRQAEPDPQTSGANEPPPTDVPTEDQARGASDGGSVTADGEPLF